MTTAESAGAPATRVVVTTAAHVVTGAAMRPTGVTTAAELYTGTIYAAKPTAGRYSGAVTCAVCGDMLCTVSR